MRRIPKEAVADGLAPRTVDRHSQRGKISIMMGCGCGDLLMEREEECSGQRVGLEVLGREARSRRRGRRASGHNGPAAWV